MQTAWSLSLLWTQHAQEPHTDLPVSYPILRNLPWAFISFSLLSPCCHFPLSLSPSVCLWGLPYPLATQAPDSSFLAVARAINTVCLVSFLAGSIKHYRPVADYSRTPAPLHLLTRRNPSQSRRRGRRRLLRLSLDPGHRPARP